MEVDFVKACLEEVALEGLDGITISALWIRLGNRVGFPIALDEKSKSYIWRVIIQQDDVEMYELPEPRGELVLYTWDARADPETGICMELEVLPENIYPFCVVDKDGVRGSCSTFDTRTNITKQIRGEDGAILFTLEQAIERWGERLVMVASQELRSRTLFGETCDPKIEISAIVFSVLERVGRARYEGELMGGKTGQSAFNETSKGMFYHRKLLVRHGLIKKQTMVLRNVQNRQSRTILVHLPRFFKMRRPRFNFLVEKICQKLAESPNHMCAFKVCRDSLGIMVSTFKKLVPLASQYIQKVEVKYGELYPDSPPEERMMANGGEKTVVALTLTKMYTGHAEEEEEGENSDEDDDKPLEAGRELKLETLYHERPLLDQVYDAVDAAGPEGMTELECRRSFGMNKLESRTIMKSLQKIGLVADSILKTFGRQRTGVYVSMRHEKSSSLHQEYKEHKSKLKELYRPHSKVTTPDTSEKKRWARDRPVHAAQDVLPDVESEDESVSEWDQSLVVNSLMRPSASLTSRALKRANMILTAVQEAKIIENTFVLQKMIVDAEAKEGGNVGKLDKKSLFRILARLAKAGQINSIKTIIKAGNREKQIHLICDKSIGPTHSLVASTIEQARLKHFMIPRDSCLSAKKKGKLATTHPDAVDENPVEMKPIAPDVPVSVRESIQKLHAFRLQGKQENMVYDPKSGRRYGIVPKFKRQKIVHQLAWYLTNGYQGKRPESPSDNTVPISFEPLPGTSGQVGVKTFQDAVNEPLVYLDELSWKRFLPPIPRHRGYPEGWFLISDILINLPVRLFCQIINVTFQIPGLLELLNDPIKQFYPVSMLPFNMTQQLMFQRKYLYCFYTILVQLCHLGLLSFGHTQHREKDQVFVYLHRNASIIDTIPSLPGYMICRPPTDQPFVTKRYYFSSMEDVEKYWCDLMDTTLSTHLGTKVDFENTHLESAMPIPEGRLSLQAALTPKTLENVRDEGIIPGDGKGAGGLDTSMFSHLHRNWDPSKVKVEEWRQKLYLRKSRLPIQPLKKDDGVKKESKDKDRSSSNAISFDKSSAHQRMPRLMPHQRLTLMETSKGKPAEIVTSRQVTGAKGNKGGKGIKRKSKVLTAEVRPKKIKKMSNAKSTTRPQPKIRNREVSDQKDRDALKLMTTHRVGWTAAEDSLLLLAKVASLFLCCKRKGILVSWAVVRDVLHDTFTVSKNKTSKACQRRVAFAMRNPQTVLNVQTFLGEALHDTSLVSDFRRKIYKCTDHDLAPTFVALLERLKEKFLSGQYSKRMLMPASLSELNASYTVTVVGTWNDQRVFRDVTSLSDVYSTVLRDIIHSYMSLDDKKGRGYEMYQLFSQYNDALLTEVFSAMRNEAIITRLKREKKSLLPRMNRVSSVHAHHLSKTYFNQLITRLPRPVYGECWDLVNRLWRLHCDSQGEGQMDLIAEKGGDAAAVVSLFAMGKLKFEAELPEQILVLDTIAMQMYPLGRGKVPIAHAGEQLQGDPEPISETETTAVSEPISGTDSTTVSEPINRTETTAVSESIGGTDSTIVSEPINRTETTAVSESISGTDSTIVSEPINRTETSAVSESISETDSTIVSEPISGTGTTIEMSRSIQGNVIMSNTEPITEQLSVRPNVANIPSGEKPGTSSDWSKMKENTSDALPEEIWASDSRTDTASDTPKTIADTNMPLNTASRSMLSVLRNQCMEGFDLKKVNPQDFFLINPCPIKASLQNTCDVSGEGAVDSLPNETFDPDQCAIFLQQAKIKNILKSQVAIQPETMDLSKVWDKLGNQLPLKTFSDTQAVYHAVDEARELGIRELDLRKQSSIQEMVYSDLVRCIQSLREERLVLRVGVSVPRYVSQRHAGPWLIHSIKDVRGRSKPTVEQAPIPSTSEKTQLEDTTETTQTILVHTLITRDETEQPASMLRETTHEDRVPLELSSPDTDLSRRTERSSTDERVTTEKRQPIKRKHSDINTEPPLYKSTYEKVTFIARPWRKPEGWLNREVLCTFLQVISSYLLIHPGSSFETLVDKFTPILQPMSTLEILELMEDIGAVTTTILQRSHKPGLFTSPVNITTDVVPTEDCSRVYEPVIDCISRIGQFSQNML